MAVALHGRSTVKQHALDRNESYIRLDHVWADKLGLARDEETQGDSGICWMEICKVCTGSPGGK